MKKISAVYKIVNTETGDCYVGSSRNVKMRWNQHRRPHIWKRYLNNPMYLDMQKYGLDKFRFQILCPVEPEYLKEVEQELIEMIQPAYNHNNAKGLDVERFREYQKEYSRSGKRKDYYIRWSQTDKGKEVNKKSCKKYNMQLCSYNGETLTLNALRKRFHRAGIEHSTLEAKKYIIGD